MLDLKAETVSHVPFSRADNICILDSQYSINQCLQLFTRESLLSAPVWDQKTKSFLGSMDLMDIVRVLVDTFGLDEIQRHDVHSLMSKRPKFTETHIKDIYDFSESNPWTPVSLDTSLNDALKLMTESDQYIRRISVVDSSKTDKKQLVAILSQAALVRHISRIGAFTDNRTHVTCVGDFYNKKKKVISLEGGKVTIEAFQLIRKTGVSGVAITDDEGHLIGSLSIRDLKGIAVNGGVELNRLLLPARSYLNLISTMSLEEKHPAISVVPSDKLSSVINKIAAARVHRLFVVDEKMLPVGVVSLVDILRELVHE
eukprot:CFRG0636T1